MLINDTVTGTSFTYSARLTAGDDDGFGLIFGYQNETNFYRVVFARQARSAGFPWHAWVVDRKVNGVTSKLFGYGTTGYAQTFANRQGIPFDVTISVDAVESPDVVGSGQSNWHFDELSVGDQPAASVGGERPGGRLHLGHERRHAAGISHPEPEPLAAGLDGRSRHSDELECRDSTARGREQHTRSAARPIGS